MFDLLHPFPRNGKYIHVYMYTRILSRIFDALNAHYFVGTGNEIALPGLPNLSLYFSLSSSFGRKIVPPKWSAAVYRTIVTAYLGSRIFHRWGRTHSARSLPSILYRESPRDYRFSRSNRPVNCRPGPSVLLRDPSRGRKI